MARIETDPNYSSPTFSRATAAGDLSKKEDIQNLAAAFSTHDHTAGKGVAVGAGTIADGSITSAKILDGTIATADLANGAVTNAKLAADTARANLLTNGGFEIWQRGNGPFTAGWSADRWVINKAAGDALSVSADGNPANIDSRSQYSAAATYTKSAGGSNIEQNLTGDVLVRCRGGALSLSVRVKCSTPNAVKIRIYSDTETASAYHTGSGVFETLTVTKTLAAVPANLLISVIFDASCTAYLDNAMLVVGSVAADYAPLHPADDLHRCQRYYETVQNPPATVTCYVDATPRQFYWVLPYTTWKATTPTATKVGTWNVAGFGQPSVAGVSVDAVTMNAASNAGAVQLATIAPGAGNSVTIEANP